MTVVDSDPRFDMHFQGRLKQVFLYVTDECNIRCTQCYYKPALKKYPAEMPTWVAEALLRRFHELGAIKVSFLGGEPTLYGQAPPNKPLAYLVEAARTIGFEYVRVVTNGLFSPVLLEDARLKLLDEITFSLDGDVPEIHDALRGRRTFVRAVANLQTAVRMGYTVHITTCAHRGNIGRDRGGQRLLVRMIEWAQNLGIKSLNLHPLLRMGVARDKWTGDTDVDPLQWLEVYQEIANAVEAGKFRIPVRIPPRFATIEQFAVHHNYMGYCSVKSADRIDVHPNGHIHVCALHNETQISVSSFRAKNARVEIQWENARNECSEYLFLSAQNHPCAVISSPAPSLLPLCISFKPGQQEFIWNSVYRVNNAAPIRSDELC
jgi:MoaA/NifB/PqqE/SkfB family radical SAM enzyme